LVVDFLEYTRIAAAIRGGKLHHITGYELHAFGGIAGQHFASDALQEVRVTGAVSIFRGDVELKALVFTMPQQFLFHARSPLTIAQLQGRRAARKGIRKHRACRRATGQLYTIVQSQVGILTDNSKLGTSRVTHDRSL